MSYYKKYLKYKNKYLDLKIQCGGSEINNGGGGGGGGDSSTASSIVSPSSKIIYRDGGFIEKPNGAAIRRISKEIEQLELSRNYYNIILSQNSANGKFYLNFSENNITKYEIIHYFIIIPIDYPFKPPVVQINNFIYTYKTDKTWEAKILITDMINNIISVPTLFNIMYNTKLDYDERHIIEKKRPEVYDYIGDITKNKIMLIVGAEPTQSNKFVIPEGYKPIYIESSFESSASNKNIIMQSYSEMKFRYFPLLIIDINQFREKFPDILFDIIIFDTGVTYWLSINKLFIKYLISMKKEEGVIIFDNMFNQFGNIESSDKKIDLIVTRFVLSGMDKDVSNHSSFLPLLRRIQFLKQVDDKYEKEQSVEEDTRISYDILNVWFSTNKHEFNSRPIEIIDYEQNSDTNTNITQINRKLKNNSTIILISDINIYHTPNTNRTSYYSIFIYIK